jgi:O-succinylbenzoate synthase
MKLTELSVHAYDLPLVQMLRLGDGMLDRRAGWLVQVRTEDGREGWGEVAPLPGFSRESPRDAWLDLQRHVPAWRGLELPDDDPVAAAAGRLAGACSSARFGLETAVWTAAGGADPAGHFWGRACTSFSLCALLAGSPADVLGRAHELAGRGHRAVKLKVGRRPAQEDADLVRRVREVLGDGPDLRLDANRAWSMEDAQAFARRVDGVAITYVEEPLRQPSELPRFADATGLRIALDETLQEGRPGTWLDVRGVAAIVVKPTVVGGLQHTRDLWKQAEARGIGCVMSAAFESGWGIRALGWLASARPEVAAGLDTYRWLAADVLAPRLALEGPEIALADLAASQLNSARLRRVL